jgi:hypothetical protein
MIRLLPFSLGCLAALSVTAASAQAPRTGSNEPTLRGLNASSAATAAAALAEAKKRPYLGGYWTPEKPIVALTTLDGKTPAMTAAGKKLHAERTAAIRKGQKDDPVDACLPPGTPRDMLSPGPMLIAQAAAKITVFHEYRHLVRHVFMDGPLKLDEPDPWWQGHVSGHWDGDVLVMETAAFNGQSWLDGAGLPESPDMKVVERFKLVDPNTLEDLISIEDAKYYAKPWTARVTFKRSEGRHFVEEECAETLLEYPLKPYAPGG